MSTKKIDTHLKMKRISYLLSIVVRAAAWFLRLFDHVKVVKYPGLPKPPYLMLSSHGSYMDFAVSFKANSPHRPYWVCTVEEFIDKYFIFRHLGVIPKRKFTNDPISSKIFMEILSERKKALVIYPEARYSFVGKEERLDSGLGALVKYTKVPVVYLRCNGHYLCYPQWGDHKYRRFRPMISEVIPVLSKEEVETLKAEEIGERINKAFRYNDYQFQKEHNIKIKYPKRAEGIERVLYKCPHCGEEFRMSSRGTTFKCEHCGALYNYNEDGSIRCLTDRSKFTNIQDWYDWEKEECRKDILAGNYSFEDKVRVEHLVGSGVGFVSMGEQFNLKHNEEGFYLSGIDEYGKTFEYERKSVVSYAVHVEYNYKEKGGCLDLATPTETYFVYPLTKEKWLTKIHFATEILFDLAKEKSQTKKEKPEIEM